MLVAEDSRVIRGLLDRALSKRGYNVVAVEDGEAALWQLRNYPFDVALLDFHLPKTRWVRRSPPRWYPSARTRQLPCFVALTSDVKRLLSRSDDRNVFDLALAKPIDLVRLCEVIESLPFMTSRHRDDEVQVSVDDGQRRYRRTSVDRGVTRITADNGSSFDCKVLDLSVGGAAVEVAARLPIGQKVRLGRTEGRVVRHISSGLAIEFTSRVMKAI